MWRWKLHTGDECGSYVSAVEQEGAQGRISEACRAEQVYSTRVSLVACGEWQEHKGIQGTTRRHQKESIIQDTSHKKLGREVGVGSGLTEGYRSEWREWRSSE